MPRVKRIYDHTFKREAVLMACEAGVQLKDVAAQLGVHPNMLSRWKKQMRDSGALSRVTTRPAGSPMLKAEDAKLRQLERQLAEAREENEVLKKAIGIFSRTSKLSTDS
jgi:transposase